MRSHKDALTDLAQKLQQEAKRQTEASTTNLQQPKKGENVIGADGSVITLGNRRGITRK